MAALKNLIDKKFSRLTVMSQGPSRSSHARWWCLCDCGNGVLVSGNDLLNKHTQSCGCLHKERAAKLGEDHWNWKGGVMPEKDSARSSAEYADWRTRVFERDIYICQKCGQRGGTLNVHHIESFYNNPELRTAIENGITFCENCHKNFHHQYGYACDRFQLTQFMEGM